MLFCDVLYDQSDGTESLCHILCGKLGTQYNPCEEYSNWSKVLHNGEYGKLNVNKVKTQ